jgi:hypothetical protein
MLKVNASKTVANYLTGIDSHMDKSHYAAIAWCIIQTARMGQII